MITADAIKRLQSFVKLMVENKVKNRPDFKRFMKEYELRISTLFNYVKEDGMPEIGSLLSADFHPTLPLILLNYSSTAHNVLHAFPKGWTPILRLCRGIVFDRQANLAALPFPKFFNYNEHAETKILPDLPFEATVKHDGHLGIIFNYQGNIILTTRGRFSSPSSNLGNEMLGKIATTHDWNCKFPTYLTVMVEMIHPQTHVHKDYEGEEKFILIGACNNVTYKDFDYNRLTFIAALLKLELTQLWHGDNIQDLIKLMKDRSVTNEEGYVIRFKNGLRVKVKFETYIGMMVSAKLTYTYLMNRMISGNLEKMLITLPEEIYDTALQILGKIMMAVSINGTPKDKWRKLYQLNPEGSSYFQQVCRNFVKHLLNK